MASIDTNVHRSYKAKDLQIFGVSDKNQIIERIFIPELVQTNSDAVLRNPKRIGFYSLKINKITGKRIYYADKSQLKYMDYKYNHHYDLTEGFNPLIVWGQDEVGLDDFLRWILENRTKFMIGRQLPSIYQLNTDFVCYRGVLTKLMITPYENREDWLFIAIKIGGTIYFHQLVTDAKNEFNQQLDKNNLFSYCGHSFEDMITRDINESPGSLRPPQLNSGETGQFCCILRSRLKSHSLVYAAEMDCVERKEQLLHPLEKLNFIEIKTTATIKSSGQKNSFNKYKSIKWWTQSYLGAVNTIFCGYRDSDNFVRETKRISLQSLVNERVHWSPDVCLNFLNRFLTYTKQCVIQEKVVYSIYCNPGQDITFTKTELPVESFIPSWYINETPPQSLI